MRYLIPRGLRIEYYDDSDRSFLSDRYTEVSEELQTLLATELPCVPYKLLIEYPLITPFEGLIEPQEGVLTIGHIVRIICARYRTIYAAESTAEEPHFGIWGHDLRDLVLEEIEITDDRTVRPIVGS